MRQAWQSRGFFRGEKRFMAMIAIAPVEQKKDEEEAPLVFLVNAVRTERRNLCLRKVVCKIPDRQRVHL